MGCVLCLEKGSCFFVFFISDLVVCLAVGCLLLQRSSSSLKWNPSRYCHHSYCFTKDLEAARWPSTSCLQSAQPSCFSNCASATAALSKATSQIPWRFRRMVLEVLVTGLAEDPFCWSLLGATERSRSLQAGARGHAAVLAPVHTTLATAKQWTAANQDQKGERWC